MHNAEFSDGSGAQGHMADAPFITFMGAAALAQSLAAHLLHKVNTEDRLDAPLSFTKNRDCSLQK